MVSVILCILLGTSFLHLMRCGQHFGRSMAWVGAWNYIAATIVCGTWWLSQPQIRCGWQEAVFGVIIGFILVGAYFLIDACIRQIGVGISQTVERLSHFLLPVLASMIVWKELPRPIQGIGLVLAVASIPLLAKGDGRRATHPHGARLVILVLTLVAVAGCAGVSFKAYTELRGSSASPALFTIFFAIAATVNVIVAAAGDVSARPTDALLGIVLGAVNVSSNYFYLRAVATVDGTVVFPTIAAGMILVSSAAAAVLWKERYHRRALIGMAVAATGLVLINLYSRS